MRRHNLLRVLRVISCVEEYKYGFFRMGLISFFMDKYIDLQCNKSRMT